MGDQIRCCGNYNGGKGLTCEKQDANDVVGRLPKELIVENAWAQALC